MGDSNTGRDSSLLPDNDFPYALVIVVIVAHVSIMAIVIYYSCCRNKCVCRINIQNNTIHQNNAGETVRIRARIAQSDTTDSDSLEGGDERPVSNWSTSLITRVRTRLHGATDIAGPRQVPGAGLPPPYSEHEARGHMNSGASFEDIDLNLPSYDDIAGRLPSWSEIQGTGRYEIEKPPTYEEVEEAKKQEQ